MPTLADIAPLRQTLAAVLAGEPRSHQALTVVPILAPMQTEPAWLTLAEAGDRVRITEVSEGGSVPDLRVANLGDLPPSSWTASSWWTPLLPSPPPRGRGQGEGAQ